MEKIIVPLDCVLVRSEFRYSVDHDKFTFAVYMQSNEFDEEYYADHIRRFEYLWYNLKPLDYEGESAGELRLNLIALKEYKRKEKFKPTTHTVRVILQQERNRIIDDFQYLQNVGMYDAFS